MPENNSQLKNDSDDSPSYNEIQKRAYELFLKHGENFSPKEYWLWAEKELRQNAKAVPIPKQSENATAGTGEAAKEKSPESGAASEDFIIAEEERRQVRATEELKKERESSTVPRAKTVAVGQQRDK
jgi:hypothetical protein